MAGRDVRGSRNISSDNWNSWPQMETQLQAAFTLEKKHWPSSDSPIVAGLYRATIWPSKLFSYSAASIITISVRVIQLKLGLQLNWNRLKRKWIQLFCDVLRNTGNERSGIKYSGVNSFESICDVSTEVRSMPQCHSPVLVEPESFDGPPLVHVETLPLRRAEEGAGAGKRTKEP